MKEIEPRREPAFSGEPKPPENEIESIRKMENYVGYEAWLLVGNDPMTRDDLSQEARVAILKVVRRKDCAREYLRMAARHAMVNYLRRGSSVDRTWGHIRRPHTYHLVGLEGLDSSNQGSASGDHRGESSFEVAADDRIMLDQLAPRLSARERTVLDLLRKGHSQAEVSRWLSCSEPTVHRIVAAIKGKAREIWRIQTALRSR